MLILSILGACQDYPGDEYTTIRGKCYYFEKQHHNFEGAVANCKTKFNNKGRLFEPRTQGGHDTAIASYARNIAKALGVDETGYWIGKSKF